MKLKLKFRADSEDLLIFIIFALFMFYVVCICVANIHTFATDGALSGINPIPAFDKGVIVTTIVFYLIALGVLLFSVKSTFFEMDEGFGITTDKKDKGYSRWAKDKEIQEELEKVNVSASTATAAGVPIILKEEEMWVDNGEYHTLVIGSTGSGKTQTVIKPQVKSLAKAGESMIITDPKGEIYEATAEMLKENGYNIFLLNFRDPQQGNAWNPLSLPYQMYQNGNQDKAIELLDDLAQNILYDESSQNSDPFWEKTSADYFAGVALGLFEDAKDEREVNINSINLMTTVGEEKFAGGTYIKAYFDAKDPASSAAVNASSTINAPTETKGSILSVFRQKVKMFASRENLSEMLSYSDLDLSRIGKEKTALFIVVQDEKKTYHALVTILLKQCYETLISVAQDNGGELPIRTNFLLDEFANMPPLKDVTTMITAARSRQIRFTFIIQNYAQLNSVYGKEDAETIKGNCGNIIYLISAELAALEEISKMCGEVKSKKDDKTASTPLVTVSDLQRMKQFEAIILRMRKQPYRVKQTPDFKIDWGKKYPAAKYPRREKMPVQVFDLKTFVKEQRQKKLLEMLNQQGDGTMPAGGGMIPGMGMPPQGMPPGMMQSAPQGIPSGMPPFIPGMGGPQVQQPARNPMPDKPSFNQEPSSKPSTPSFEMDQLLKKIDARIAELEEEEKRNQEELDKNTEKDNNDEEKEKSSNLDSLHKEVVGREEKEEFFDDFFD